MKWTPADVVGYLRLMAHDLQQSWKVELVFGALVEKFGTEKIKALFPVNIDDITFAPPDASLGALFSAMATHETILRELTGMNGTVMGSNNWVISGSRTAS